MGSSTISAYGLIRYLNQNDDDEVFTDHLGNERTIDLRNDIFAHRVIVFLNGWLASPKLRYILFLWTVSSTDQDAIFGVLGYQFSRKFSSLRRASTQPRLPLAAGLAPVLARPRSRDGRRVLPAVLHLWSLGERARCSPGSGTRP